MRLEDRLRYTLGRRANLVAPSDRAWTSIERAVGRGARRKRTTQVLVPVLALLISSSGLLVVWAAFSGHRSDLTEGTVGNHNLSPRVAATIDVGPNVSAVTAGTEGVWVIRGSVDGTCSGTLVSIDPATNSLGVAVSLPVGPSEVAQGFGSLWVVGVTCSDTTGYDGVVSRVDAATGEILANIQVGDIPFGIAAGENAMWVGRDIGGDGQSGQVIRIDPATNTIEARIETEHGVRQVVTGEGAVWVRVLTGDDSATPGVLRIDPHTNAVSAKLAPGAWAVAVGDGGVWVPGALSTYDPSATGNAGDQPAAVRFDPVTTEVSGQPVPLGDTVFLPFAVGEGGVWFLGGRTEARIERLNTSTLQVDESVFLGDHHSLDSVLDVGNSSIWVADESNGTIVRVTLR